MKSLIFLIAATAGDPAATFDPAKIDLLDAISCRIDAPDYNGFAMAISGEEALAVKKGWRKVEAGNPFMNEYELPAPITVAGHYATRRIAFTSGGVLAILDEPDPAVVAKPEGVANAMDPEPLIRAIVASGKATRAEVEKAMTFRKFLGEKVLVDRRAAPADGESFGTHTIIALNISNDTTHPGKTLYGCSYRVELTDKNGKPL